MSYQTTVRIEVPSDARAGVTVPISVTISGIGNTGGRINCYWMYHGIGTEDSTPIFTNKGFVLPLGANTSVTLNSSFKMPNATVVVWAQVEVNILAGMNLGSYMPDNWDQRAVTLDTSVGGEEGDLIGSILPVILPSSIKAGTPIVLKFDCNVRNTAQLPIGNPLLSWKGRLTVGGLLTKTVSREFYCLGTDEGGPEKPMEFPLGNMPDRDITITAFLEAQDYTDLIMTKFYRVETQTYTIKSLPADSPYTPGDEDDEEENGGTGELPPPGETDWLLYGALGLVGLAVLSLVIPKRRKSQQSTVLLLPQSTAVAPYQQGADEPGYRRAAALYGYGR